jgi:hypothetical protein
MLKCNNFSSASSFFCFFGGCSRSYFPLAKRTYELLLVLVPVLVPVAGAGAVAVQQFLLH